MFRTILLAIDPTHEDSWKEALPRASALARAAGGKLHIAAVVPDFGMSMVGSYFPKDFEANALIRAREDLAAFAEREAPTDVEVELHVGHGDVAEQILSLAESTQADLIVMASRQPDRLRTLLVGSHADKIVHESPVSVLVVR